MQADEVQNAKEPIAAQIDLSGQTLTTMVFALILLAVLQLDALAQVSLFDGKSLDGWSVLQNETKLWRVEDGFLTGGSLTADVPHNSFITTKKSYQNFDLTLKIRIQGAGGFVNSGVQIRSVRLPNNHEMCGYQVDAGEGWWGKLYDESRRNRVIAEPIDQRAVNQAVRPNDWNEYRIRAEGRRIRSWINGVPALDYREQDLTIPQDGLIGIQVHGGGKALVQMKEMSIEELPATSQTLSWESLKKLEEDAARPVLTAADERRQFLVPDDFEVELVAEESPEYGKFVAVAFDAAGRMWTMTALEYPIDANESPAESAATFAAGGRDQVLVYDDVYGNRPSTPRVFAQGLVIPLGILPYRHGVFVQYGTEIRFYHDDDGDGKADGYRVFLAGFGTQDSHLFPHQFTRVPGESFLLAQGLFNSSKVRRGNGQPFRNGDTEVTFNHCKLAKVSLDGSQFEPVTAGPNNIWGLTISQLGEAWLQEANDMGYPIAPYFPGSLYPTGSSERLRTYQPRSPASFAKPVMGGTGLSGLALADDRNGWPAPWGKAQAAATDPLPAEPLPAEPLHFYLANPITNRIQHITASIQENRYYSYEKQPDLLISLDKNFRPVSVQFGPDGCLYFVDWYNKIISHNEVARNHPDRDKTHGRIWRLRHRTQSRIVPPNLMKLSDAELLGYLGDPNSRTADLAWQQIVDRQAKHLLPELSKRISSEEIPVEKRLGALWSYEGLVSVPIEMLVTLSRDSNPHLRREAVRIASRHASTEADFLAVARHLAHDPDRQVRFALGDALRHLPFGGPETIALMLQFADMPVTGMPVTDEPVKDEPQAAYDREFTRYLARWAMEGHPQEVLDFLNSPAGKAMPIEGKMLATLSLQGKLAASLLVEQLPELTRPLNDEELRLLASQLQTSEVAQAIQRLLQNERTALNTVLALRRLRTSVDLSALQSLISQTIVKSWAGPGDPQQQQTLLELAGEFQVAEMDQPVLKLITQQGLSPSLKRTALKTLRELRTSHPEQLLGLVQAASNEPQLQDEILAAVAAARRRAPFSQLVKVLPTLSFAQRQLLYEQLAAHREGSLDLLNGIEEGEIDDSEISLAALEAMRVLHPEHAVVRKLWNQIGQRIQYVLRLKGHAGDFLAEPISLSGPFTIETWARLDAGISQADGLLGHAGVADLNFFNGQIRFWLGGGLNDVVVSSKKTISGTWTHYALSRDASGRFTLFVNGEPSGTSQAKNLNPIENLYVGRTTPSNAGTAGEFLEYRIWSIARASDEIRANFDRKLASSNPPDGLVRVYQGQEWGALHGQAAIDPILDGPNLLNEEQAREQALKFARFRELANRPGDVQKGRLLFEEKCLVCHTQAGKGGKIGPALDGMGHHGVEAFLRNVLTPSAAMEGGYRNFRVLTRDGRILNGLLVSQGTDGVVIRAPNTADQKIPQAEIDRAEFTSVSIMPERQLEGMLPQQVSDLIHYVMTLK